jgi:hypothetical protein
MAKTTLFRKLKEGKIKRVSNAVKPLLTDPANRPNIPINLHPQTANLLADAHNVASVSSNQQAPESSTNTTTSVSEPAGGLFARVQR